MSKKPLQVVTAGLGLIPVVTGAVAMLGVDDPLYASIGLPWGARGSQSHVHSAGSSLLQRWARRLPTAGRCAGSSA